MNCRETYECNQYSEDFTTHNGLKSHIRIYSREKNYGCNQYGTVFTTQQSGTSYKNTYWRDI